MAGRDWKFWRPEDDFDVTGGASCVAVDEFMRVIYGKGIAALYGVLGIARYAGHACILRSTLFALVYTTYHSSRFS